MEFTENLKQLRLEKGLSQRQVATSIGLSTRAYCYYENGLREPSIETIKNLCKFFNCSSDFLLGLTDF